MLFIDKMINISKIKYFPIASSLVLLAIFFCSFDTSAQIPKLLLKFAEKHNKIQSGYVKVQRTNINRDTTIRIEDNFFISTPKDLKSLVYNQDSSLTYTYCKSAHTFGEIKIFENTGDTLYSYNDEIKNAKQNPSLSYFMAGGMDIENSWKFHKFQRIPPKINKKNIRYKIIYPEQEFLSNISGEWEFDRKTFYLIQTELSAIFAETDTVSNKIDILEQFLSEYIHPDILDTISFKFEEIKKEYNKQCAEEQLEKDEALRIHLTDSIFQIFIQKGINIPQELQRENFMPEWKFPLLSGDTIYSDSIHSRFLLIDLWFIDCPPCMKALTELSTIDSLYEDSFLKIVSINALNKDTAKINKVIRNFNLKYDVACAFRSNTITEMSKKMGNCKGYPQLYLVDMETRQVIWHSCGWQQGFTKKMEEIEEIIEKQREKQ